MRGMPINLQGKGVPEAAAATETLWRSAARRVTDSSGGKDSIWKEGPEPRSVLDHRRSPSPPTSTSTLSSSLGGGGGGGSIDTASVAAVSDNPLHKWPPSQDTTSSGAAEDAVGGDGSSGRKEEWASELQPIPAGMEIGLMGGDKCGLGMEDWETVLSEPAAVTASPGHDQTFLRWIMGDVDYPSSLGLKQQSHQQALPQASLEFEGGAGGSGGFGVVDPVFGFEPTFGIGGGGSSSVAAPPLPCSAPVASGWGFPVLNNNGGTNNGNRVPPIPPGAVPLPGIKSSPFGNNSNPSLVFSSSPASTIPLPLSMPPDMLFQEPAVGDKAHLFNPNALLNPQQVQPPQNPAFFLPLSPYTQQDHHQQHLLLPSQPKRHHSMVDPSCQVPPRITASNFDQDLFLRRHQQPQQQQPPPPPPSFENLHAHSNHSPQSRQMKPKLPGGEATAAAAQQQQQALVDQLVKAAELVEAGNFVNAHGILARLNHHLSPMGKPLIRSAFYCKEALQWIITHHSSSTPLSPSPPLQRNPSPSALCSPVDVVLKLSAYKAFSDTSPILQFANFTCTQALLEELSGFDRIHIVDFDIGVGGHWSSFMQELGQRRCAVTAASPSLRITAFVSLSSHHPFELGLTRENLSHFASELNIQFEFNILSLDSFDPATLLSMSQTGEAIAVNLPAGSAYPSIPTLLRLVKQLAPKVVVSVDFGCDHSDFTFSRHFLHVLQTTTVLLDSIDATGSTQEVANKIERYLLQPRIENSVMGRHRAADKALPWWTLFASAGFVSASFSNFTETQAECLLKRLQVRGFHVEKRQASLLLCWQRVGLVSVSAWRC